jgi:hypothetical protein
MKILGVLTMAVMAAASDCEAEIDGAAERKVMVCMASNADFAVFWRAESVAADMFAKAGVRIEWKSYDACPREAIRISFSDHTNADFLPGAFAYAMPYEGVHIVVFYGRVKLIEPAKFPYVLAHVLVHEITHVVQGVSRHSESGVMKAHWTSGDLSQMAFKPLPFTPADIVLIHRGLDARQLRLTAATAAGRLVAVQ